jgi:hypothetical protein
MEPKTIVKAQNGFKNSNKIILVFFIGFTFLISVFFSCQTDPYGSKWVEDDMQTI